MASGNKGAIPQGFSIIELLVVVGLIAILAAIAVPAYIGYTKNSKLVEGPKELSALRIRMEQFFQDNRTYSNGTTCGASVANAKYFTFTCVAASLQATQYLWQASNKANVGLGAAGDYVYTINQLGAEQTTAHPKILATQNCWLVKKSAC